LILSLRNSRNLRAKGGSTSSKRILWLAVVWARRFKKNRCLPWRFML
jgi:hypothetical protein